MNLRQVTLGVLMLCTGTAVNAQPLHQLDAIEAALQNNSELAIARNQTLQADAQYHQTDAALLPQIGITYSALTTNNPLSAFAFKLQQQSITQNDFNPALLNHPGNTSNFTTQAIIQQPLLNVDALFMRKAAKTAIEIARLQQSRLGDYIRFRTESAYLQLQLAYEVVSVLRKAVETADSLYTFTKARFEQGYLQKSDLLNAEVHLKDAQSKLAIAESNVKDQSDNLSLLMHKPTGIDYQVDSLQPVVTDLSGTVSDNRADLKAMHQALIAQDMSLKGIASGLLPRINGFGNLQLNDARALGFSNNSYLFGLQLSWNFFQGNSVHSQFRKQQLVKEQTSLQLQQMKEASQKELEVTKRKISDASYQIAQAGIATKQAEEVLYILRNRYGQGLAGSTDMLLAQTQLSQQQLNYHQSVMMLNLSIAYLKFLTAN